MADIAEKVIGGHRIEYEQTPPISPRNNNNIFKTEKQKTTFPSALGNDYQFDLSING